MAGKGSSGFGPEGVSGVRPKRRPSPAVYRRRRLVALIVLVLVAAGLTAGGVAIANVVAGAIAPTERSASRSESSAAGSAKDSPNRSRTVKDSGTANGSGASAPAPAKCDESRVVVTASMDAASYPAGKFPVLTLTVTNRGKAVCNVNVGTAQMEYLITSGNDRIFSSADCQMGAANLMKALGPGKSEKANFQWRRNRTAPGCSPVESKPGVGYYKFQARLGERESKVVSFQLT